MRPTRSVFALTLLALLPAALAQSAAPSRSSVAQSIPATPPKTGGTPARALPAMSREAVITRGRQLVTWFYAQNLEPVWAAFLPTARADFGGDLNIFKAYRAGGVTTYGQETRLISEEVQQDEGVTYYLRTATFERGPRVQWTVAFGMDSMGRVVTFGILGGTEVAPEQQAVGAGHRL